MASKPINLDDDPALEVMSLEQLRRKAGLPYHMTTTLVEWVDDPNVPTPKPRIRVNGEWHWDATEENANAFVELTKIDEWLSAERRLRALDEVALKASVIVEHLIFHAKDVVRLNKRCGKHNRGNSLQDGRMRAIELRGEITFVKSLLQTVEVDMPLYKSQEISALLREAKDQVNMQ